MSFIRSKMSSPSRRNTSSRSSVASSDGSLPSTPSSGATTPSDAQASFDGRERKHPAARPQASRGRSQDSLSQTSSLSTSNKSRASRGLDEFKQAAKSWLSPKSSRQSLPLSNAVQAPVPRGSQRLAPKRAATFDGSTLRTGVPKTMAFLKRQVRGGASRPATTLPKDFAIKAGVARNAGDSAKIHAALTSLGYVGADGQLVKKRLLLSEQTVLKVMQACAQRGQTLGPREAAMVLVALGSRIAAAMGERTAVSPGTPLHVRVLPRAERKDFFVVAGLTASRTTSRQAMHILKEEGVLSADYLPQSVMALRSPVIRRLQEIDGFASSLQEAAAQAAGDEGVRPPKMRQILHELFFVPA